MSDKMLKVENVSKAYRLNQVTLAAKRSEAASDDPAKKRAQERIRPDGLFMALSDVSFEVDTGEAVGLIGRNGAGKSTLLKLITRITQPTSGKIYINGQVASMIEIGTGFHRELTGRENIYVNGAVLGMNRREIDKKLDEIIDFSDCRHFIDMPVKHYSSGMYSRLAFSVAAHLEADILLLDEILAVGDIAFRNKCARKIKEIAAAGRTILYVSHNMNSIRNICNRCLVLDHGRLDFDGDVEDAIHYYITEKCPSDVVPPASSFATGRTRDLAQLERPYRTHEEVRMEYIELENDNMFLKGKKFRFRLRWTAKKSFERLCLRAGIWSADGSAAAVSFADIPDALTGEGTHEESFCLDTSNLLPGKYCLELLIIEKDCLQNMWKQDVLRDTLTFEVLNFADHPVYQSLNKDWGYFELPMSAD